jgi:ADP-ribosylglycohydrolase
MWIVYSVNSLVCVKNLVQGINYMSQPPPNPDLHARFTGLLLGTAVGDALGLPAEGLSRGRIQRMWRGVWRHRFLFGRGMVSDDTEHMWFVAQSLLTHPNDVVAFQRCLAWKFRFWLLGLPAGVGLATTRAILKLWLGFPPNRSGVWSAGNGPAMRSAILGAYFSDDANKRRAFVSASTRLTHTDPKAEAAALAVAEAVAHEVANPGQHGSSGLLAILRELSPESDWQDRIAQTVESLKRKDSVQDFACSLGLNNGVSGYSLHTVPVALYAWCRHPGDFRRALTDVLDCGGDTDTVGAILGALCGASCGPNGIPKEWLDGIVEWPRSIKVMRVLAERLAEQKTGDQPLGGVRYFWPGQIFRNTVFLVVVILHGFRRLLPPY